MSVVAMESQCMVTIMIHLIDKGDFMRTEDCDFSCTKLSLHKISAVVKTNLAKKLAPYSITFISKLLRYLELLKNREEFTNWFTRVVLKKLMLHYKDKYC